MPEKQRILIQPSAYYHIYNRGINRRTIFREEADYLRFLHLLNKYLDPVGEVLSYALLPNHFHLAVLMKPKDDIPPVLMRKPHTLGNTFGHLQNAYAKYFNAKYNTVSSLFEKHFERSLVTTLDYFRQLVVYIHRNPERHSICADFKNHFWTSYQEFSHPGVTPHVNLELTIEKFGGLDEFFHAHQAPIPLVLQDLDWE